MADGQNFQVVDVGKIDPKVRTYSRPVLTAPSDITHRFEFTAASRERINVVDDGGPVLDDARIWLVFWGNGWSHDPVADQISHAVDVIISSPYLSKLSQYRAFKKPTNAGRLFIDDAARNRVFSDDDARDRITDAVYAGALPWPSQTQGQTFPILIPRPGYIPDGNRGNGRGFHGYAVLPIGGFGPYEIQPYAMVSTASGLDYHTAVLGHEIVEGMTNPYSNAITVNYYCCTGDELVDLPIGYEGSVQGVNLPSYWSQVDKDEVLPGKDSRVITGPIAGGRP